jgi:cellulose synthase/poly-beta-1,6-N-acetylglucosamine synthase-like glycosyltransferase
LLVFIEGDVETKKRKITHFPLVSLVIPAYNEGKRHLRETIDSVLALNYPMDKLEIIAVNHGSTDDTGEIMDPLVFIEKIF